MRLKVAPYLRDAMTLLVENRPEDPLRFLADYFENATDNLPATTRSYKSIRLVQHFCYIIAPLLLLRHLI
jgi:tubulin polyglutamylase complex subunit 1